jgi:glutamate dehydrogenase/leucine dehydrogenase
MERTIIKNPGESEFHQAVKEVLESLEPVIQQHPEFVKAKILDRIIEPDRQIMFRVTWAMTRVTYRSIVDIGWSSTAHWVLIKGV